MSLIGLLLSTSLIFVALWVVLCGFDIVASHRNLQRLGIITEAQIVRISQQSVMSQNSQGLTQRAHQAFEIVRFTLKNNTSFETPLRFDVKSDIKAPRTTGSRVMVAYNPDNPKEVIDISTVRAQWQGWLALGLGLMTGGLALFGLLICCRHLWFASTAIKAFSLLSLALISLIASRLTWQFWEDSLALNFTSTLVSETVSSGGLILTANNMQPFTGPGVSGISCPGRLLQVGNLARLPIFFMGFRLDLAFVGAEVEGPTRSVGGSSSDPTNAARAGLAHMRRRAACERPKIALL